MKLLSIDVVKIDQVTGLYSTVLASVMEFIVSRYEAIGDYRWIDTKICIATGMDYSEEDVFRGRNTVYGWIQGRALEALAVHAEWFEKNSIQPELVVRMKKIISEVLTHLEHVKRLNGGHLSFFMDKDGKAFTANNKNEVEYIFEELIETYNLSDLFCSKGMYAAAKYLGLPESEQEAKKYCMDVVDAIWNGNFVSDQVSFRGKIMSSGRILNSIGPYMISLDMADMLLQDEPDYAVELGKKLIERILVNHINLKDEWGFGEKYDCVENIDSDSLPMLVDNMVESDPGHSAEFSGLAMRFLYNSKKHITMSRYQDVFGRYEDVLKNVLKKSFQNGFIREFGGICKSIDLISRNVIDSDMPWWSLPETMRGALYCAVSSDFEEKEQFWDIFNECHSGLVNNYMRPELNYISVQTIGDDGFVSNAIPATPDIDPGYHTGICLIDCLRILEEI